MAIPEHLLSQLRQSLAEFVLLLEREARALEDLQTEDLANIVAHKADCADRVSRDWLALAGSVPADPGQTGGIAAAVAADPERGARWQEIARLAQTAASLNQTNGILIAAQLKRTREAIDILQDAAKGGRLYGESGQILDTLTTHRTLDKA